MLEPSPANPLLTSTPGAFDSVKVGPRVVLKEGPTTYRMWYEGVPAANRASVGYATSADGLTWSRSPAPVLEPSEPWEGGPDGEISPNTVLLEDGVFKMWYHSWDGAHRRIGHATSPDGLRWTKHPGNPVLDVGNPGEWDDGQVTEPRVLRIGGVYFMWYMGRSAREEQLSLGLATSGDGLAWERHPTSPVLVPGPPGAWDERRAAPGGIVRDGATFHLYYSGHDERFRGGIGYATSPDGVSWTKSSGNPILGEPVVGNPACRNPGDSVTAYQDGDEYRVLYGSLVERRWSICMAVSRPGS